MKKGILIFAVMLSGIVASYSKGLKAGFKHVPAVAAGEEVLTNASNLNDTVTMVVINDAFVAQVLNRDLTIRNILKAYHFIDTYVKLIPNKNKGKVKDTLINFTKAKTTYSFLKTSEGNTLTSAHIEGNTISTAGIAVGISKDKFEKMIAVPNVSDVVIIEDKERTHRFIYTFNGKKLASIVYESPYHNY
jgi:hypothetical protein